MTILNSTLLLGMVFVSVPVVLHFLMRQRPRKLIFPALRLVQERRRKSVRRLRLRHIWLMLLRMLALGLLIFALSRPSLPPANYELTFGELVTLCLVIAAGIAGYLFSVRRLRQRRLPPFQYEQHKSSRRTWTIAATLLALLLLVGWPYQRRLAAEITDPAPPSELNLPVAGVLIFDNSLSTSYLQAGKTSLNQAQQIARDHLETLPAGSRIAIADVSADRPILFQSTLSSAHSRIEALQPSPVALPIEERLRAAVAAHDDDRQRTLSDQSRLSEKERKDRYIRRIYVFTDMAKSAWSRGGNRLLQQELTEAKGVNLYVIDVGSQDIKDQAITQVNLSRERVPLGGDLQVSCVALSQGEEVPEQTIELMLRTEGGQLAKHGQTTLNLPAGTPTQAEFSVISGVSNRWIHGEARVVGVDPATFDNTRYFTAEVVEPPAVLLVAPRESMAYFWSLALAPFEGVNQSRNKFAPKFVPLAGLRQVNLSDYAAVALINCPQLSDDNWFQLGKYVEDGGGLITVLGSMEIDPTSYNRAQAQAFLPATLSEWRPRNDWRLSIEDRNHPIFWKFRQRENYGAFAAVENDVVIERFWKVTPSEGANVLATFDDDQHSAALIERSHGRGRTVLFATGADLPDNRRERFSTFPLVDWLFIAFAEQVTEYVSRFTDEQHNYLSGETIVLHFEPARTERTFLLQQPDLRQTRTALPAGETLLKLADVSLPGHYDLISTESRLTEAAFSINSDPDEADFARLTSADLDDLLGKDRYQMAASLDELKDDINAADIGQEIYPLLLVLMVIAFCGEHFVANHFYNSSPVSGGN